MADSLAQDWWSELADAFRLHGIVIEPDAEAYIREILAKGEQQANESKAEPNGSARQLTDALVREGIHHTKLSENQVKDTMTTLCPIWPFC